VADTATRTSRFERQMSPAEALMWNVEKDPWLNPNGGSLSLLDGPVDIEVFEQWMRSTVAAIPRLRDRVVPGIGRLERPSWRPDPEFDFGYHIRHVDLPPPGTERDLLDLVAILHQEPYDRTRPLWQVHVIGGLEDDGSAVFFKWHHSIADGYGMARIQKRFMVRDPDASVPGPVDLDAIVAASCAEAEAEGGDSRLDVPRMVGRPFGVARRTLGRAAIMAVDPGAMGEATTSARDMVTMVARQVRPGSGEPAEEADAGPAGSPLWVGRSRHRHLEVLRVPFAEVRRAATALKGSVNDIFMTGLTNGVVAHHEARGARATAFNSSFVVSTRSDREEGGNSFTPVRVQLPGGPMTPVERLRAIQARVDRQRSAVRGGGLMGSMAGVVNLLPTSLTTSVARSQAARIDFATTNVRSSSEPLYIAGRKMTAVFAPGPVAGSAMIVSVLSYNGTMHLTLTIDPAAITEPAALRDDIAAAYEELFAAA
jgi:WS/DGAT/MGAT family acyltransferase